MTVNPLYAEIDRLKAKNEREIRDREEKINTLVDEILTAAVVGGILDKNWSSLTEADVTILAKYGRENRRT